MADSIKISELDELVSGSVLGTTIVPVVDGGTTQHTKMSSIKAYVNSDVATDSELAAAIAGVNSTITALTTDDVSETFSNQYYTDARVKTKLNAEGVLSGSSLTVTDGSTTLNLIDTLTFSGATINNNGTGNAGITISAASALTVTDGGSTTVNSVDKITFSGASVTDNGSGDVTIASGLRVIDTVLPTIVNGVDQITFDGATVTNNGSGDITVSIAAGGDSTNILIHTSSINSFTSSVNEHIFDVATYTSSVDDTLTSIDAHIFDVASFTSSFSSSVESRILSLETTPTGTPTGSISSSQQITDFGFYSSSADIDGDIKFLAGAGIGITSGSGASTFDITISNTLAGFGGGGDVSYTAGWHILSQSVLADDSNLLLSEVLLRSGDSTTFAAFSQSIEAALGSGGAGSDYISNVSFGNNTLTFTGQGFGFNGSVPLSNGLVSSSQQITDLGFLNDGNITDIYLATKLPRGIVSGSGQASDFLSGTGIVSSSDQILLQFTDSSSFTTANIDEDSNFLYYTDERVKTKLDVEGVISSSLQINLPIGLVSGGAQIDYAQTYNQLELRANSQAILIQSGTAAYGNPYVSIGLDNSVFASGQTEIDLAALSLAFYGVNIPTSSAQLTQLGAVATIDLNNAVNGLNAFTGSLGGFGVASSSLASRITTIENSAGGITVEAGYQLISQSNSATNLILDIARIDSSGTTFSQYSASVAAGGGAGASTFAGLTDTQFSSFVGGDLVKYNATTEKWENTFQLNGSYVITGSLIVTGGAVTADSFVAGDVGTPIIDSATSLDISAATEIYLTSTGNGVVIEDILVLNPIVGDAPTSPLSGSIMASGSDGSFKPYFWDGNSWREISLV